MNLRSPEGKPRSGVRQFAVGIMVVMSAAAIGVGDRLSNGKLSDDVPKFAGEVAATTGKVVGNVGTMAVRAVRSDGEVDCLGDIVHPIRPGDNYASLAKDLAHGNLDPDLIERKIRGLNNNAELSRRSEANTFAYCGEPN